MCLQTPFDIFRKERKNIGIESSTEFKRITLPPQPTNLLIHELRRVSNISNKGCQVDSFLEFAPIGRAIYLKGNEPILQWRKFAVRYGKDASTLIPIIQLLAKLTRRLEASSKHLKIVFMAQRLSTVVFSIKKEYHQHIEDASQTTRIYQL